jgi:TonB family protein
LNEVEIMRILLFLTTILLLSSSPAGVDCFAQRHKPSTPEERAKVVQMARDLETNPLSEEAKRAQRWFKKWIKDVPDITVAPCPRLLDPVDKSEESYAGGLILQTELSSAAFIIEHPDQAENPHAAFKAGIDGMLKMYQVGLETNPKLRWPFLDTLLEMQKAGKTGEYVREVMAKCSSVPLSDRNTNSYHAGDTVYSPIEVSRRAKILKKPTPDYSQEARMRGIEGIVVLEAVFASAGRVSDIMIIKGLPSGLTEKAVDAASRIKFEPALIGNRPVSTVVQLEYHFHLF